jgi:hypothetical protein
MIRAGAQWCGPQWQASESHQLRSQWTPKLQWPEVFIMVLFRSLKIFRQSLLRQAVQLVVKARAGCVPPWVAHGGGLELQGTAARRENRRNWLLP